MDSSKVKESITLLMLIKSMRASSAWGALKVGGLRLGMMVVNMKVTSKTERKMERVLSFGVMDQSILALGEMTNNMVLEFFVRMEPSVMENGSMENVLDGSNPILLSSEMASTISY